MNTDPKEKTLEYELIQYEGYSPKNNKTFKLTEVEAHDLNYAFALNRIAKRYIKVGEASKNN